MSVAGGSFAPIRFGRKQVPPSRTYRGGNRRVKVSAHLRDFHGYTLAQSVQRGPAEMARIHDGEHAETVCNHPADWLETKGQS